MTQHFLYWNNIYQEYIDFSVFDYLINNVMLNDDCYYTFQDTPLSCEPTLLPEPKHVMLNHLYALSIKDGVMVLSSTQRFKQVWSLIANYPANFELNVKQGLQVYQTSNYQRAKMKISIIVKVLWEFQDECPHKITSAST